MKDSTSIVMTKFKRDDSIKAWAVATVTYKNGLYIHTNIGTYFKEDGAEQSFIREQGLEWEGEETFDDLIS